MRDGEIATALMMLIICCPVGFVLRLNAFLHCLLCRGHNCLRSFINIHRQHRHYNVYTLYTHIRRYTVYKNTFHTLRNGNIDLISRNARDRIVLFFSYMSNRMIGTRGFN